MAHEVTFFLVSAMAVALLGLSKGGFVGVGALSLPLMALVISPVRAAAILLPILIVQDMVGISAFRRHLDRRVLLVMLPGSVVGIALGYLLAAKVSATAVLAAVGALSIVFGIQRLWAERGGTLTAPANAPLWLGAVFGMASGFASQIAHAGGPPYQMWVMPRGLPRDVFVGTTAVFFGATNWLKVPAYVALGQFSAENLIVTAWLMPIAILSAAAGVYLVKRIPAERFYTLIYLLMIVVGARLLAQAL